MSDEWEPPHPGLAARVAARRGDVAYLIDALSEPEARGYAARYLGRLGAREAVPALTRNLRVKNDGDLNLTIKALGAIGDPSPVPALLEVAREAEAAGVGSPEGVAMLAQLATDPRPLLADCSRTFDAPSLRELRSKYFPQVGKWAARRLRELHATEAAPALTAALGSADLRHRMRLRRTIRSLRN